MSADTPSREDHDTVFQMIMSSLVSQTVRTLATMRVAEHLDAGPLTSAEIARREGTDPGMTYRMLRAAAALGMVRHDTTSGTFSGTSRLAVLHGDSPMSLRYYAMGANSRAFWLPSLYMPQTVAKGANHFAEALGCEVFEYFAQHPDEAREFSAAMTGLSVPVIREAVAVIEAPTGLAVDVGGAEGAFVCELVAANPGLRGAVLELPHAAPGAEAEIRRRGLDDRVTAIAGDFFVEVPEGDLYLLKFVLHDWDDTSCLALLRTIRRTMRPGARVCIVEAAVSEADPSPIAALLDMAMLLATTGQERELRQFEKLLDGADLAVQRVVPVTAPYHLIEAVAR